MPSNRIDTMLIWITSHMKATLVQIKKKKVASQTNLRASFPYILNSQYKLCVYYSSSYPSDVWFVFCLILILSNSFCASAFSPFLFASLLLLVFISLPVNQWFELLSVKHQCFSLFYSNASKYNFIHWKYERHRKHFEWFISNRAER